MAKVSSFLIGLIVASFIIAGFTTYMSQMSDHYGGDFDNSSYDSYNKMQEINLLVEELDNETVALDTNLLDEISAFFGDAYRVLKLTKKSYDTFDDMLNSATDDIDIGFIAAPLKMMISSVVLIMITIGVILSAFLKKDV